MKEKISEIKGAAFPAMHQKLIAQGRIMADHDKVKTYDLKSVKFVVIMVSKPNTAGPQPAAASTETPAASAAAPEAKPAETSKEAPKEGEFLVIPSVNCVSSCFEPESNDLDQCSLITTLLFSSWHSHGSTAFHHNAECRNERGQ